MTDDQKTRWQQGCRAVFAGFVAAAPGLGLTPNIGSFWQTEQKDIVLASLQTLADAETDASNGDPRRALFDLLSTTANESTRRVKGESETGDLVAWDRVIWELTPKGKKMFPFPLKTATAEPRGEKWWNG